MESLSIRIQVERSVAEFLGIAKMRKAMDHIFKDTKDFTRYKLLEQIFSISVKHGMAWHGIHPHR